MGIVIPDTEGNDYLASVRKNYSMPMIKWLAMAFENWKSRTPQEKIDETLQTEKAYRDMLIERQENHFTVVLVENDQSIRELETRLLADVGYEVLPFGLPSSAIRCLYLVRPASFPRIFVAGIRANPERDGPERLHQLVKERWPRSTFIYTSGANTAEVREVVERTGANLYYHTGKADLGAVVEMYVEGGAARRSQ